MHTEPPTDLIPTNEAIRLIPGDTPGRTLHLASLYRWLNEGRLRKWKVGGRIKVSRAEVLALIRPVEPRHPRKQEPREPTRAECERITSEVLRRHGLE